MKVSIIVPTYKDTVALKLILKALNEQTYTNFEVIVAEDDNSPQTAQLLQDIDVKFEIKHVYHEDKGNRKPRVVNKAIKISSGEYIIFIDGDTLPYSSFVENHVKLSSPKVGLCGRRVNLGDKVSKDLREGKITVAKIEKSYLSLYKYLTSDNIRHYEQGITLNPKSVLFKVLSHFDKNKNIVASNFSCYKQVLLAVNGIDEALPYAPSRDDYDLQWRLEHIGVVMKSCKFSANLLHLNHSRNDRASEDEHNRKLIQKKQKNNEYRCRVGIIQD